MSLIEQQKTIGLPKPNYKYITNEEEAKKAIEFLSKYPIHAIDTETTALNPYEAKWTLLQVGVSDHAFVFDMRNDTEFSSIPHETIDTLLRMPDKTRILQNAAYDMKIIKVNRGYYLDNLYDTMLSEQLMHLGMFTKADLGSLVLKYLGLDMPKEPRTTFTEYAQNFQEFQLDYAANDVVPLHMIRDMQMSRIKQEKLDNALRLELDFLVPLCEMELNGILIDKDKWRIIMKDVEHERDEIKSIIHTILGETESQRTLFGIPTLNIDSPAQLSKALKRSGLDLKSTDKAELSKFRGIPVIDAVLDYRQSSKLISTYAETLLDQISKHTGRLHTGFKQMVATGRMSSSSPNLQNIPAKQKFRSCFIAPEGYSLITSDMSGAELRILGNLSADPVFLEAYATGQDVHTRTASEMFGVPYDKVEISQRKAAKSINFGLCYGMSPVGLAQRIGVTKKRAEELIVKYFKAYKGVKRFLENSAKEAVRNRCSVTVAGRKRYYNMPPYDHPDRKKMQGSVERRGKNAPIQGANADTIKEAMILLVERLKSYDARLILTVHDEVVVEANNSQVREISKVVSQSLIDGFGKYFSLIPMEADALIGPCWLKDGCENKVNNEKCGGTEMKFIPHFKYGTKLVCSKCGKEQD